MFGNGGGRGCFADCFDLWHARPLKREFFKLRAVDARKRHRECDRQHVSCGSGAGGRRRLRAAAAVVIAFYEQDVATQKRKEDDLNVGAGLA